MLQWSYFLKNMVLNPFFSQNPGSLHPTPFQPMLFVVVLIKVTDNDTLRSAGMNELFILQIDTDMVCFFGAGGGKENEVSLTESAT